MVKHLSAVYLLINTHFHLQIQQRQDANTHLFTADLPYHCIQFLLIQSALTISQLSFFSSGPLCLYPVLYLISISFASVFPFPQGYLYPCYVPAVFPLFTSLDFSCLSALHSIFRSTFCSYSSAEDP